MQNKRKKLYKNFSLVNIVHKLVLRADYDFLTIYFFSWVQPTEALFRRRRQSSWFEPGFYNNNNNDKDDAKIRENTNLHFQYLKYTTVKGQPQPDLRQKCLCQSG